MQVKVRYRGPDGREYEAAPGEMRAVPLERCEPLREPHAHHGRRSILTRYWAATTKGMVVCGSERLMYAATLLDFDSSVEWFSATATQIHWQDGSLHGVVEPAFFARTTSGERLVIVHPARDDGGHAREADAIACAADAAGWTVAPVDVPTGVRRAWLKVLAGHRFPEFHDAKAREALLQAFTVPRPIAAGVAAAGLAGTAIAHAWHLLWTGDLSFDQDRALIPTSPAWACAAGREAV
ncbi:hypothetical protein [Streptomyces sp. BE303]|uniref:hypothetical protein n=1 Tax=Streptomyces sp. BE303 TaxID=3002528 RepID=UPI002E7A60DF|nr:hypothetical protein [Streptomyces sp. BE303]MED7947412.1 hypothetical protein [Streptomyces sp. BE303]